MVCANITLVARLMTNLVVTMGRTADVGGFCFEVPAYPSGDLSPQFE